MSDSQQDQGEPKPLPSIPRVEVVKELTRTPMETGERPERPPQRQQNDLPQAEQ